MTGKPNSSTGAASRAFSAWEARQCSSLGFTLVEILVVVLLIGLTTTVVVANLMPTAEERLRDDSARLMAALEVARDEAVFGGRAIAVEVAEAEIRFHERDPADPTRWLPAADPALAPRPQDDRFRARLREGATHVVFLPAGVAQPFVLDLASPAGTRRIDGDALGNVTLTDPAAAR